MKGALRPSEFPGRAWGSDLRAVDARSRVRSGVGEGGKGASQYGQRSSGFVVGTECKPF